MFVFKTSSHFVPLFSLETALLIKAEFKNAGNAGNPTYLKKMKTRTFCAKRLLIGAWTGSPVSGNLLVKCRQIEPCKSRVILNKTS